MLETIAIRDFTIIDQVELDLSNGMTALTGETGAGKSILLDAIKLVLGDRADSDCVKQGCARADINVTFDTRDVAAAQQWLQQNEYALAGDECLLRRVIQANGRSKAFLPLGHNYVSLENYWWTCIASTSTSRCSNQVSSLSYWTARWRSQSWCGKSANALPNTAKANNVY